MAPAMPFVDQRSHCRWRHRCAGPCCRGAATILPAFPPRPRSWPITASHTPKTGSAAPRGDGTRDFGNRVAMRHRQRPAPAIDLQNVDIAAPQAVAGCDAAMAMMALPVPPGKERKGRIGVADDADFDMGDLAFQTSAEQNRSVDGALAAPCAPDDGQSGRSAPTPQDKQQVRDVAPMILPMTMCVMPVSTAPSWITSVRRRCAGTTMASADDNGGTFDCCQLDIVPDKVVPAQQQQSDAGEQQQGQCHGIVPDGREVFATD